jgi:hypothetical protein
MVADGCMARLKDPIHFPRCLHMTGVSLGSYISKPFSRITTSSIDIVMKMLSVMSYNWHHLHDYIMTTSCNGGEKLWHITDSIFMIIPWLLVVMGRNALTYSWQHFHDYDLTTSCNWEERRWHNWQHFHDYVNTTSCNSSHDIVM